MASESRVGVIIKSPENCLFHDLVNVILTSRMVVRELDDDVQTLGIFFYRFKERKVYQIPPLKERLHLL